MAQVEPRSTARQHYLEFVPSEVLRVLTGPLAGATFDVGDRLVLGRLAACDVHLLDAEVSREHAMLVREDDQIVLVDLDSSNGTIVDGQAVSRRILGSGDLFMVGASQFALQLCEKSRATKDGKATGLRAMGVEDATLSSPSRGMVRRSVLEDATEPGPMPARRVTDYVTDPPVADFDDRETGRFIRLQDEDFNFEVSFEDMEVEEAEEEETLEYVAAHPGFSAVPVGLPTSDYDGDLLADITAYRTLRLRVRRGDFPEGPDAIEMIGLEARVRGITPDRDEKSDLTCEGFFHRFGFVTNACVRLGRGSQVHHLPGVTVDLSVDGVRCTLEPHETMPQIDEFAVLLIDGVRDGLPVVYSFTARVVWVRDRDYGFVFAGAPGWQERSASVELVDTVIRVAFGGTESKVS